MCDEVSHNTVDAHRSQSESEDRQNSREDRSSLRKQLLRLSKHVETVESKRWQKVFIERSQRCAHGSQSVSRAPGNANQHSVGLKRIRGEINVHGIDSRKVEKSDVLGYAYYFVFFPVPGALVVSERPSQLEMLSYRVFPWPSCASGRLADHGNGKQFLGLLRGEGPPADEWSA